MCRGLREPSSGGGELGGAHGRVVRLGPLIVGARGSDWWVFAGALDALLVVALWEGIAGDLAKLWLEKGVVLRLSGRGWGLVVLVVGGSV